MLTVLTHLGLGISVRCLTSPKYWALCQNVIPHIWDNTRSEIQVYYQIPHVSAPPPPPPPLEEANNKCFIHHQSLCIMIFTLRWVTLIPDRRLTWRRCRGVADVTVDLVDVTQFHDRNTCTKIQCYYYVVTLP